MSASTPRGLARAQDFIHSGIDPWVFVDCDPPLPRFATRHVMNAFYVVIVYEDFSKMALRTGGVTLPTGWTWLSIRRQDRRAIRDWRHLQRIKNVLCDPEREGYELFPAESRLIDTSNQFHLFVAPLGLRAPFGYLYRDVMDADEVARSGTGAVQRPFEKEKAP